METLYIGIDLHGATFQACALAADGRRLWEQRFARDEGGMATFRERCPPSSAVAIEATTPTWHFVDAIAPGVTRVTVVDPLRTRLKAGYAAKTDRLDARRLADALRRDSVVGIYYPPPAIRELRELCRSRHALVRTRTALIQRIRALLLRHGVREARRRVTSRTGLAWLETVALPSQATAGVGRLRRILAVVLAESAAIDAEVGQVAHADPVVDRLVSIPGIGPVLGLTLRAEIGDISRFATPKHLASYAGVVPRVEASAGRTQYRRITKMGSPWLRWALIEAALHGMRRQDAQGRWARRLAVRKGAMRTYVAVGRALCDEIWRTWPRA